MTNTTGFWLSRGTSLSYYSLSRSLGFGGHLHTGGVGEMELQDRVEIVSIESEFWGAQGTIVDFTQDGGIVVKLSGADWTIRFEPHEIDLLPPLD